MTNCKNRSGRALLLTGATFAGLIALGAAAHAADAAATGEKATQVETLVVTAQRRSENIQNVPISIQAFGQKDIQALGIKSSLDLGAVTPNVDIAQVAGPGNQPIITIRGIGLNDYDTNNAGPNGIYVDDVYLSAPSSQTFQTFDLSRIEVLKGPQGTLYGRNTNGGAINFVTNKPTDEFTGQFHIEYGSFQTFNLEAAVGGPIAPGLDGRVAFVKNNSSGFFHNDLTGNSENGTNNYAARVQIQAKPSSDLTVLLNVHGGQVDNRVTEYRHIGVLNPVDGSLCTVSQSYAGGCVDALGYGTPSNFYGGSFNRQDHLKVNSLGASLRADYRMGSVNLTSLTAFEHNDKLHPEDSDASPNRLLEINFGVRSNEFTQELRASQSTDKYNWVLGAYFLHEDLKQNQPIFILLDGDKFFGGPGSADGIAFQAFDRSDQVTDTYAVFGQGSYSLTDKLKLTLGGRYTGEKRTFAYLGTIQFQEGGMDHFGPLQTLADSQSQLTDSAFSWRAALDYRLAHGVLAYGSIATGFKSGGFNGSFLSTDPLVIPIQLQPVKPEFVTSYELGLKTTVLDGRLLFDAAAFYNEYTNMQVFTLAPPPVGQSLGVNILGNAPKAHTEGIEVQMVARPVQALTASLQLGWLNTKLDKYLAFQVAGATDYSGNQLANAPHFSLSSLIDYKIPVGQDALDLQFSVTYKSHQFFDTTNDLYTTQAGYWLENARIAYSFDHSKWEIAGYVRNLSDKKYLIDAFDLGFLGFIQGITGTPRTFGAELNYKF